MSFRELDSSKTHFWQDSRQKLRRKYQTVRDANSDWTIGFPKISFFRNLSCELTYSTVEDNVAKDIRLKTFQVRSPGFLRQTWLFNTDVLFDFGQRKRCSSSLMSSLVKFRVNLNTNSLSPFEEAWVLDNVFLKTMSEQLWRNFEVQQRLLLWSSYSDVLAFERLVITRYFMPSCH